MLLKFLTIITLAAATVAVGADSNNSPQAETVPAITAENFEALVLRSERAALIYLHTASTPDLAGHLDLLNQLAKKHGARVLVAHNDVHAFPFIVKSLASQVRRVSVPSLLFISASCDEGIVQELEEMSLAEIERVLKAGESLCQAGPAPGRLMARRQIGLLPIVVDNSQETEHRPCAEASAACGT